MDGCRMCRRERSTSCETSANCEKNEVLIPGNFSLLSHFLAAIMAEQWDKILSLAQKNDGAGIKAILNA